MGAQTEKILIWICPVIGRVKRANAKKAAGGGAEEEDED